MNTIERLLTEMYDRLRYLRVGGRTSPAEDELTFRHERPRNLEVAAMTGRHIVCVACHPDDCGECRGYHKLSWTHRYEGEPIPVELRQKDMDKCREAFLVEDLSQAGLCLGGELPDEVVWLGDLGRLNGIWTGGLLPFLWWGELAVGHPDLEDYVLPTVLRALAERLGASEEAISERRIGFGRGTASVSHEEAPCESMAALRAGMSGYSVERLAVSKTWPSGAREEVELDHLRASDDPGMDCIGVSCVADDARTMFETILALRVPTHPPENVGEAAMWLLRGDLGARFVEDRHVRKWSLRDEWKTKPRDVALCRLIYPGDATDLLFVLKKLCKYYDTHGVGERGS